MSIWIGAGGYRYVMLNARGECYSHKVARLVLETFVGPCPDGMECRHLDGNKLNDDLENLCWGTRYENIQDKVIHGTHKAVGGLNSADWKAIWVKILLTSTTFTGCEIARIVKVNKDTVSNIKTRKTHAWL